MTKKGLPSPLVGVLDQGISSISNLAATIAVARLSTPREFGAFGVIMGVYLLMITLSKGFISGPVSIRLSRVTDGFRDFASHALGASLAVGGVVGLIALGGSAFAGRELWAMLLILATSIPSLLLQDSLRQLAYAKHRPWAALLNSSAWLAAQTVCFAVLFAAGHASPLALASAWAFSSLTGVLVGLALMRLTIRPLSALTWFRNHASLIRSMSLEYALIAGVAQGAPLLIGAVSGLPAVGAVRAALTAFGPFTMLSHGLAMAMVPTAAREWGRGRPRFYRGMAVVGVALGISCTLWGVFLTLVPDAAGRSLFSDTWQPAKSLFVLVGLWLSLGYLTEPAVSALRISERSWLAAWIRLVLAPLTLGLCVAGAIIGQARGAVIALVAASFIAFLSYWAMFRRSRIARVEPSTDPRSPDDRH